MTFTQERQDLGWFDQASLIPQCANPFAGAAKTGVAQTGAGAGADLDDIRRGHLTACQQT